MKQTNNKAQTNKTQTQLCQPENAIQNFKSLSTPVVRASTVLFDSVKKLRNRDWLDKTQYTYGLLGTPTTRQLAKEIAAIDAVEHCLLAPSGLAAINLILMTVVKPNAVVYLPDNVYFPAYQACQWLAGQYGITLKTYQPTDLAALSFVENTALVWVETPGSVTMEIADLKAIAALAHASNALVAVDATWAAGIALPVFKLGSDISVQALTKYQSGGSDVMMGAVTTNDDALYAALWNTYVTMGMGVSPADCQIISRSLPHMAVRYQAQDKVARNIAAWCENQAAIEEVLHPALANAPGHDIWKKDFTGAASLFSIVFKASIPQTAIDQMVDTLALFYIGFSWGGATSLAVPFKQSELHNGYAYQGGLVRLYIGLEDEADLIADLAQAIAPLNALCD